MGNKRIYQKIESLQIVVDLHLKKIQDEIDSFYPDAGLIHHWEAEVEAHEDRIKRLKRRLGK
jgi:hypothetical protein